MSEPRWAVLCIPYRGTEMLPDRAQVLLFDDEDEADAYAIANRDIESSFQGLECHVVECDYGAWR